MSEGLIVSDEHQEWLQRSDAALQYSPAELQQLATHVGTRINQDATIIMQDLPVYMSVSPNPEYVRIRWPVPERPLHIPTDQARLTGNIALSLAQMRHEAQRRFVNFWGGITFAAGIVAAAGGELLQQDPVKYGGVGMMAGALGALGWINNFRREATAPSLKGVTAQPVRIVRTNEQSL